MLALALVVITFCFVVFFGAPYLPTLKPQVRAAFDLLSLPTGSHILELGAGDGRVALEALKRGYRVTAVELNPILCMIMFFVTLRYRRQIRIICADFWRLSWPDTDAIFVFLLDKYMPKLEAKIQTRYTSVKLVSFAFKIPGKNITAEKAGVYLYDFH